jgi:hypothetical protein
MPGLRTGVLEKKRFSLHKWNDEHVAQYSQADIDNEVTTASALEEDTEGRQEDGTDDLNGVCVRPCGCQDPDEKAVLTLMMSDPVKGILNVYVRRYQMR